MAGPHAGEDVNLTVRLIRKLARTLFRLTASRWQQPPARQMENLVRSLRQEMKATKMQPASSAGRWSENCAALIHDVLTKDPQTFLQWPVMQQTMTVYGPDYIDLEFRHLRSHSEWRFWKTALQETAVGRIPPYWRYPWTSESTIHHCYHLVRFLEYCSAEMASFACIIEYGGGYGNLCRLARAGGFSGEYAITDLPQFLVLQRFYLDATGTRARLIPPHAYASWLERNDLRNGVFIATWSLSETPLTDRAPFAAALSKFAGVLIAFQYEFAGMDNLSYFRAVHDGLRTTHTCSIEPIEHLPGNSYLFALRKSWNAARPRAKT